MAWNPFEMCITYICDSTFECILLRIAQFNGLILWEERVRANSSLYLTWAIGTCKCIYCCTLINWSIFRTKLVTFCIVWIEFLLVYQMQNFLHSFEHVYMDGVHEKSDREAIRKMSLELTFPGHLVRCLGPARYSPGS